MAESTLTVVKSSVATVSSKPTTATQTTQRENFEYVQSTPSKTWDVTHNMGKFPCVAILESTGDVITCLVRHLSRNRCILVFGAPTSGTATFN